MSSVRSRSVRVASLVGTLALVLGMSVAHAATTVVIDGHDLTGDGVTWDMGNP